MMSRTQPHSMNPKNHAVAQRALCVVVESRPNPIDSYQLARECKMRMKTKSQIFDGRTVAEVRFVLRQVRNTALVIVLDHLCSLLNALMESEKRIGVAADLVHTAQC